MPTPSQDSPTKKYPVQTHEIAPVDVAVAPVQAADLASPDTSPCLYCGAATAWVCIVVPGRPPRQVNQPASGDLGPSPRIHKHLHHLATIPGEISGLVHTWSCGRPGPDALPLKAEMGDAYLAYKRSKFATRLPADRRFTESHFWLAPESGGVHRIGFTKFATRMLGEIVEFDFEIQPGDQIEEGQVIGWFEGFKAVSELYSPLSGRFGGPNPDLEKVIGDIHNFPYDRGWLYRVTGEAPEDCMTAPDYARFLDGTIDRMLGET